MTNTGTIAAAREADRLFCITALGAPDGPAAVPVTWAEIDRDADWAVQVLTAYGVGQSSCRVAAVVSACEDVPFVAPFQEFLLAQGITYVGVDALGIDVNRLTAYLRRLPVDLVLGIDGATVEALAALAPLEALLGEVRWLFARPDAAEPLRRAGLSPRLWTLLGPAVAVECPLGGVHVNGGEWQLDTAGESVLISTRRPRGHAWSRWPIAGITVAPAACACGSADPCLRVSLPSGR